MILGPTVFLLSIEGLLEELLEIGRYGWKGVFKAYILRGRVEGFRAFMKELFGVEQSANISFYCKYTTLLLVTVFAIFLAEIFQKGDFLAKIF